MQTETQKLRVLRARTDQDLLALVQREVERGLTIVELATTKTSQLYAQALKAYDTATKLLMRIPLSAGDDRLRMEARVRELRMRLEQIPTVSKANSYPASFAS